MKNTMYELLKTLEKEEQVEITELKHAYRVNGVIDIYKGGGTFYDIIQNKYDKPDSPTKLNWCLERIRKYPKQPAFKKTEKGGISYQEFKNSSWRNDMKLDGNDAEDYQWNQNYQTFGDDDLYFLIHDGKIKIGRSKDPTKRAIELSTALSHKYNVYVWKGKGFLEPILHKCFKKYNTKREWFTDNARIRRFITRYHIGPNCSRF